MPAPLVSVIIPTLNRDLPLCETLDYFLTKETYHPFEILVIDQSERHDLATEDFLRRSGDRIRHVRASYKSLPRARNHGVRLAQGAFVVFVDDDVEPSPGFLNGHIAPFADPNVVGVTGPILLPGQPLVGKKEVGEKVVAALWAGSLARADVDFEYPISWVPGGNTSFRRETVLALGGYDENFFGVALGEDAEFSHRVKQKGGRFHYAPAARLIHKVAPAGGTREDRRGLAVRNLVANTQYLRTKIGMSRFQRCLRLMTDFRRLVCNREVLVKHNPFHIALQFFRGMALARKLLRQPGPRQNRFLQPNP